MGLFGVTKSHIHPCGQFPSRFQAVGCRCVLAPVCLIRERGVSPPRTKVGPWFPPRRRAGPWSREVHVCPMPAVTGQLPLPEEC
ncbi:hypothetical protein DPMN_033168 [Dreissena polymorpha]|uniref:Uncharacterized protein n=1 Tax=Dreissena polymorpha TaxID=45954 RepID=A0A9D4M3A9_DREPO|nr:hypothetical protein DPMN_033168 [Dreissena polymorpha]